MSKTPTTKISREAITLFEQALPMIESKRIRDSISSESHRPFWLAFVQKNLSKLDPTKLAGYVLAVAMG